MPTTGCSRDESGRICLPPHGRPEEAFDRVMTGVATPSYEADPHTFLEYGPYRALSVTLSHLMQHRAGIAFTSYAHTGVPVPVLALGQASELFAGSYDNTDIPKKLAQAMCIEL